MKTEKQIDALEYNRLLRYAGVEMDGTQHIFNSINIFEARDLVHDFYLSFWYEENLSPPFLKRAFDNFIARKIRDGKKRHSIVPAIVNSQNKVLAAFPGNYKDDDLIDGYIYRKTPRKGSDRWYAAYLQYSQRGHMTTEEWIEVHNNIAIRIFLLDMCTCVSKHNRDELYKIAWLHIAELLPGKTNEYYMRQGLAAACEYYRQCINEQRRKCWGHSALYRRIRRKVDAK